MAALLDWFFWLASLLQAGDLQLFGSAVSRAEWLGALMGLAMVWCNARLHPMGWVLAMSSSLLYALVFWSGRLYGQAALQLLFVAMAAWGLRQWLGARANAAPTPDSPAALEPRRLDAAQWPGVLGATMMLWGLLGAALWSGTDSTVPWADALPTAGAVVATWLLAQRYRENWLAWLAVNVLSVGLFAHQGLWPTTLLYTIFAGLSWWGWRQWART